MFSNILIFNQTTVKNQNVFILLLFYVIYVMAIYVNVSGLGK